MAAALSTAEVNVLVKLRQEGREVLDQLNANMNTVRTSASTASAALVDMGAQARAGASAVTSAQADAQRSLTTTGERVQSVREYFTNLYGTLKEGSEAVSAWARDWMAARTQLDETAQATERASEKIKEHGNKTEEAGNKTEGADKKTKGWLATIGGLVGSAALIGAVMGTAQWANNLQDLASRHEVSTQAIQKWDSAARGHGGTVEKVSAIFSVAQDKIAGSDKSFVAALDRAGVSFEDLKQHSPDEQMRILAKAVTDATDPTERMSRATDLFNGSARGLVPTLADIAGRYDELPALGDDLIRNTGQIAAAWDSMKLVGLGLMTQVLSPIAQLFANDVPGAAQQTLGVMPFLQEAFTGLIGVGLEYEKVILDTQIKLNEFAAYITSTFSNTIGTLITGNMIELQKQSTALDDKIKALRLQVQGMTADAQAQAPALAGAAAVHKELTAQLHEMESAYKALSGPQRSAIAAGLELNLSAKDIAATLKAQHPEWKISEGLIKFYVDRVREAEQAHKAAEREAKAHQRALNQLDAQKAANQIAELARDIDSARAAGATSVDVLEEFGKRMLAAGQDARVFGIDIRSVSTYLDDMIKSAKQAEIDKALAQAHAEGRRELQRILRDQTEDIDRERKLREDREYESSKRILQQNRDLVEERARLTMNETEFKLFQLRRWRDEEIAALDKSSADYKLMAEQIEQIYRVRLMQAQQDWAREHGLTWDRLKETAKRGAEDIKQSFTSNVAAMLTGAESFAEGWKGIWSSIKDYATNILKEILEYYLNQFIARLITGMGGGGGGVTGALLQAATTSGNGGGGYGGYGAGGGSYTGTIYEQGARWAYGAMFGGGAAATAVPGITMTTSAIPAGAGGFGVMGASPGVASAATSGTSAATTSSSTTFGGLSTGALAGGALAGGAGLGLGLLGTKIFGGAGWEAAGFGAGTGAAAGALIGTYVVPGIGTGVGAGVGALAGLIGGWIGKSVGEKINDARDEFLNQFGETQGGKPGSGFTNLQADLARIQDQRGEQRHLLEDLLKADDWKELNAAVREITKTLESTEFATMKVGDAFRELGAERDKMIAQGRTEEEILAAQAGGYSLLLDTIKKTGAEAPDALVPILAKLIDMGLLVDEAGNKITNLDDIALARLQEGLEGMGTEGTEAVDQINAQLDLLVEKGIISKERAESLRQSLTKVRDGVGPIDEVIDRTDRLGEEIAEAYSRARDLAEALANMPDAPDLPDGASYSTRPEGLAARGFHAQRPGLLVVGEGGEDEIGGPRSFFRDVLQSLGVGSTEGGLGGGHTFHFNISAGPGTDYVRLRQFLERDLLPLAAQILNANPGEIRTIWNQATQGA